MNLTRLFVFCCASRPLVQMGLLGLMLSSFGCAIEQPGKCHVQHLRSPVYYGPVDRVFSKLDADSRANSAWRDYQSQCGRDYCSQFESGFKRACRDIAMGGDGAVPPVPPPRFWSYTYRDQVGHAQGAEWFRGYETGAAYAEGWKTYNEVPSSSNAALVIPPTYGESKRLNEGFSSVQNDVSTDR